MSLLWFLTYLSTATLHSVSQKGGDDLGHDDLQLGHVFGKQRFGDLDLTLLQPYIYEGGKLCNVDTRCLTLIKREELSGSDTLGDFDSDRLTFQTSQRTPIEFSWRTYGSQTVVFKQKFPKGLKGTSMGDANGVSTAFPRVLFPGEEQAPGLKYFTPGGKMIGWTNMSIGSVEKDLDDFRYGEFGGLAVLFQERSQGIVWSVAMSPLTEAMAANLWLDRDSSVLDWGVQGQAEDIKPGFAMEVIIQFHPSSINSLIMDWGANLRKYHATWRMEDPSTKYLNYYTDNGAYYYYNTGDYNDYTQAIMSVRNRSLELGLPIRYLELDSWWYFKGLEDGVKNWTLIPGVIPGGIKNLGDTTGWKIVAHNRYFSSDTDYAQQNGGAYPFTIDTANKKALPLDKSFWDGLFDTGKKWGLTTYIQDWLNEQYENTTALHTNLTLGKSWLDDMGQSALERDIRVMYCMSYIRHILHSVTTPAVTQARASEDFKNNDKQWRIGVTSLIAYALDLVPFKDTFRSSNLIHPHLQAAVSTLSGGTVGPGDRAEDLDSTLLMKSCRSDGLLLHPSKPLTIIDKYFLSEDFREIWTGHSVIGEYTFGIVFLEDIKETQNLTAVELNLEEALRTNAILWQNYPLNSNYLSEVSPGEVVGIPSCEGAFNFCLYYTSPVFKTSETSFYILGEMSKWVPVSPIRVADIEVSDADVTITLKGISSEEIEFSFYDETSVFSITCHFQKIGTMKISLSSKECQ